MKCSRLCIFLRWLQFCSSKHFCPLAVSHMVLQTRQQTTRNVICISPYWEFNSFLKTRNIFLGWYFIIENYNNNAVLLKYVFLILESEHCISPTFNQVWYCLKRFVLSLREDNNTNENGFSANAVQNSSALFKWMISLVFFSPPMWPLLEGQIKC